MPRDDRIGSIIAPPKSLSDAETTPVRAAWRWLNAFEAALAAEDLAAVADLLTPDCCWRDIVAFSGTLGTLEGIASVAAAMVKRQQWVGARRFVVARDRPAPAIEHRLGVEVVEVFFEFETSIGAGAGVARLPLATCAADGVRPKAWVVLTTLEALPERPCAPPGRTRVSAAAPDVLVVGAGHAGLAVAARLRRQGVDTLTIDRHARVGDSWRARYASLKLHNPSYANHLPYKKFPADWPTYMPAGALADWLEGYAADQRLDVRTGVTLRAAAYDATVGRWTVETEGDGAGQRLRPRHLVLAAGAACAPKRVRLPGLDRFRGVVQHSSEYRDPTAWRGRRALVVGAGNSAFDIAQDLCEAGAETTLVQRGPTTVVSLDPSDRLGYVSYETGAMEDADLRIMATGPSLMRAAMRNAAAYFAELDKEMIAGLEARGFKFDLGEDGAGHLMKNRRRGGGFVVDTGCAQLIIDGRVGVLPYEDIESFVEDGACLKSGDLRPADLIVLATGFDTQASLLRQVAGDAMADRVGECWGMDPDGEMKNLWKRTAQLGLWFTGGALAQSRVYSKYLALQIAADLRGLSAPPLAARTVAA